MIGILRKDSGLPQQADVYAWSEHYEESFATIILFFLPITIVNGAERSLTFSMTDNYVLRGITQADDKTSIQADYLISGLKDSGYYVGLFTSNVAQGAEIDLHGGLKFTLDNYPGKSFDLGR